MHGGLPNDPNVLSQSEKVLGNFFAAKDVMERNPGGSKKKWPLVVAGLLLAFVITLLVSVMLISSGALNMENRPAQTTSTAQESPLPPDTMIPTGRPL